MKKYIKGLIAIVEGEGFKVHYIEQSKHLKVHTDLGVFFAGVTPSDHLATKNFRAQVRRAAKAA